jgi:hypothetical protein
MSEDITKIHHVEMTFDHTIAFDIQEIANSNNFEIADIAEIRVRQVGAPTYHFKRWQSYYRRWL